MGTIHLAEVRCEGKPELRVPPHELARHDADDGVELVVETNRLTDDVRVSAKPVHPESIIHHHNPCCAGPVLFRQKPAAEKRLHTQHGKRVRGHLSTDDALGVSVLDKVRVSAYSGDDVIEDVCAFSQILELGHGEKGAALFAELREFTARRDDPVGSFVWPWINQRAFYNTKYGRACANPERERYHGYCCKRRTLD